MKHLSNSALSSDVTFNANCITLMITEAVSELLHCICYMHLLLSLIFCFLEQLLIVPLFLTSRIWRARLLWMSSGRRWSAQTARLNPHSVFAWHGLLMDRYNSSVHIWLSLYWLILAWNPSDYTNSLVTLMLADDSPANMRGTIKSKSDCYTIVGWLYV